MLFDLQLVCVEPTTPHREVIAEAATLLRERGITHRVGPTSTAIEGDWDEVMPVLKACHEFARRSGGKAVTTIRIEDSGANGGRLEHNVDAVEQELSV